MAVTARKRVLLIDDHAPTQRVIRLALQGDFAIDVASSRDEGIALLLQERPDIVIMDYLMDGLSPTAFIEQARVAAFNGPILLCTATDQQIQLPVDDVLLKPFDPDELAPLLRSMLSRPATSFA